MEVLSDESISRMRAAEISKQVCARLVFVNYYPYICVVSLVLYLLWCGYYSLSVGILDESASELETVAYLAVWGSALMLLIYTVYFLYICLGNGGPLELCKPQFALAGYLVMSSLISFMMHAVLYYRRWSFLSDRVPIMGETVALFPMVTAVTRCCDFRLSVRRRRLWLAETFFFCVAGVMCTSMMTDHRQGLPTLCLLCSGYLSLQFRRDYKRYRSVMVSNRPKEAPLVVGLPRHVDQISFDQSIFVEQQIAGGAVTGLGASGSRAKADQYILQNDFIVRGM
jgi:hypothetical protein